jgi:MoxR-like ATPase
MKGAAGSGKTTALQLAAGISGRPFFYFNLGSTNDPRSAIIGNTHFDKNKGTYFAQSEFITAITTPNAVILMDELSRINLEAGNILLTVLDHQRYLRIDESPETPVIRVAEGVSFLATANIGSEYTGTITIDQALRERFGIEIEMDLLTKEKQHELIKIRYPEVSDKEIEVLTSIYAQINQEVENDSGRIQVGISTRKILEVARLINNGFTMGEAMEAVIIKNFSKDGGAESERFYVKQIIQRYVADDELSNDNIFSHSV